MTEIEKSAMQVIWESREGWVTCSELGDALWGRPGRHQQAFARSAGRLLHRLKDRGLAEPFLAPHGLRDRRIGWQLTDKGAQAFNRARKASPSQ